MVPSPKSIATNPLGICPGFGFASIQKPIRDRLVEKQETQDKINVDEEGLTPGEAKKLTVKLNRKMREYAKLLEFEQAAKTRDKIEKIKERFDM